MAFAHCHGAPGHRGHGARLLSAQPAVSSAAQTIGATTGALNGRVTDKTGAVLPGVVVVASGAAMMGTRTTVTDARGTFEVPAVPPGDGTRWRSRCPGSGRRSAKASA